MEPEQTPVEQSVSKFENLHKVTPLSRYLAMALFIVLPFLGGWVGYTLTPEKVVKVEKIVEFESNALNTSFAYDDSVLKQKWESLIPGEGHTFIIRNGRVYSVTGAIFGSALDFYELQNITPENFEILGEADIGSYISDGQSVFYLARSYLDAISDIQLNNLPNVNKGNFEILRLENVNGKQLVFGKSNGKIFYKDKLLDGLNADSVKFNIFNMSLYDEDTLWEPDYSCAVYDYVPGVRDSFDPESTNGPC